MAVVGFQATRSYAAVSGGQRPPTDEATKDAKAKAGQQDPLGAPPEPLETKPTLASQLLEKEQLFPSDTTQAKSKKRSMSSIERKRQNMTRILTILGGCGLAYGAYYLGRDWESQYERERLGQLALKELGVSTAEEAVSLSEFKKRLARTKVRAMDLADYFNKPAWEPLLPAPLPEPHQRPYTLVVELDDILVRSNWSRDSGWKTAKRPGIEDFLGYLSQFYEIVVFTEQPHYTAMPILDKIDPLSYYFMYRLYRDATRYYNGTLVKDLSYLGRDLSKVIILETDPTHVQTQPENAIVVPPWKGDKNDDRLLAYLPFLEALALNRVQDVRPILQGYKDKNIPLEFAKRQEAFKQQQIEEWKARKAQTLGGFSVGSLFGLSKPNADEPPMTMLEAERKRYLDHYQKDVKAFKDSEPMLLAQMEAEREKQMKEMKNSLFGFLATMGQPPGAPPQQQ